MAKYRGMIKLTEEAIAQLLGLPDTVSIKTISIDEETGTMRVILGSGRPIKNLTYQIAEGSSIPCVPLPEKV